MDSLKASNVVLHCTNLLTVSRSYSYTLFAFTLALVFLNNFCCVHLVTTNYISFEALQMSQLLNYKTLQSSYEQARYGLLNISPYFPMVGS